MVESTIGIKIGDGTFFPILEESFIGKKRFVLTTINDNQSSVQIDFYSSLESRMEDSEYIGSLVIEDIEPAQKKEPEIEVIIGIDSENSLHAIARNLSSANERQSLTVSLESLSSGHTYDVPEFELDEDIQPTALFESDQDMDTGTTILTGDTYPVEHENSRKEHLSKRRSNPLALVLFVLGGIFIIAAITLGIFWFIDNYSTPGKPEIVVKSVSTGEPREPVDNKTGMPVVRETATSAEPVVEIDAATQAPLMEEAVKSREPVTTAAPSIIQKKNGFWHNVKKGDTLWDLAEKFYGNPWYYYKIYDANVNVIRDPGLIIIATKIYIPE